MSWTEGLDTLLTERVSAPNDLSVTDRGDCRQAMNASSSSFSSAIPGWIGEAFGRPSATEAMQWLLATIGQQVGADVCLVLRLNGAGTHGSLASSYGPSAQALSRDLYPLGGSTIEHIFSAPAPVALERSMFSRDPWLAKLGIAGGAAVALQQGPMKFGSLGVYFTHDDVDVSDTIALLTEIRMLMWPLLCWQILGAENGTSSAAMGAVHRANNILSNIVLLTDLALDTPCGRDDEHLRTLLLRMASEGVRCADVLREISPG